METNEIRPEQIFTVERVSYAREDTPETDREYKVYGYANSCVGTKSNWREFAESKGFKCLRCFESDGSITFEFFNEENGKPKKCELCDGTGEMEIGETFKERFGDFEECPQCLGKGEIDGD